MQENSAVNGESSSANSPDHLQERTAKRILTALHTETPLRSAKFVEVSRNDIASAPREQFRATVGDWERNRRTGVVTDQTGSRVSFGALHQVNGNEWVAPQGHVLTHVPGTDNIFVSEAGNYFNGQGDRLILYRPQRNKEGRFDLNIGGEESVVVDPICFRDSGGRIIDIWGHSFPGGVSVANVSPTLVKGSDNLFRTGSEVVTPLAFQSGAGVIYDDYGRTLGEYVDTQGTIPQDAGETQRSDPDEQTPVVVGERGEQVSSQSGTLEAQSTPESRAQSITQHVLKAEFDSFQEYTLSAEMGNSPVARTFIVKRMNDGVGGFRRIEDDDIVDTSATKYISRSSSLLYALEDLFDIPRKRDLNARRSDMTLFCVAGEKDGKFILQGGGYIHGDGSNRRNPSTFKIVFDEAEPLDDFLGWVQDTPNEALSSVLERLMSTYDAQGNPSENMFPKDQSLVQGVRHNPFVSPIREAKIMRFG